MITIWENSFVTLEEANIYFQNRLNGEKWANLSASEKEKALITATKHLNNLCFTGVKESVSQPLEFPRKYKGTMVQGCPLDIKDATCEEALALLNYSSSPHLTNRELGIQEITIGSTSTKYQTATGFGGLLSPCAWGMVCKWVQKGFDIK